MEKKYLLDSNFFLDSSLRYYQNDFFKDFWVWIKKRIANSQSIRSIKKVRQELSKKSDFVSDFVKELPKSFFIDEIKYLDSYRQVIKKSANMDFHSNAKEKFADEHRADAWLLAVALSDKYVIVSNEKIPDKKEKKNIKIPRMCYELDIKCINIFDFIKEQKVEFCIKNMPKDSLFE